MIQKRFLFKETSAVYLPQVQHVVVNRNLSKSERKDLASYLFWYCRDANPSFAERWLPANHDDLIFLTWEVSHFSHLVDTIITNPFRTKGILLRGERDEQIFHLVNDWLDSIQPNEPNIRKAIEHLKLLPQKNFSMAVYRHGNTARPHQACDSVGCVIGHCTVLDDNVLDFYGEIKYDPNKLYCHFSYHTWSISFFGVNDQEIHDYLFSSDWESTDNSVSSAIERLELFLEHGSDLMKFVHENNLVLP